MSGRNRGELFVVRHASCDLYIVERKGTWARWGNRSEAIELTREEWENALSLTLDRSQIALMSAVPS